MFTFHHAAISVSELDRSVAFYELLGFEEVYRWEAQDGTLEIRHLDLAGVILELFCYQAAHDDPLLRSGTGGNLDEVGLKHVALKVDSVVEARGRLQAAGIALETEIKTGRTEIQFFFVRDPDGLWVEIVEDHRALPTQSG
jgi:glyoxylase I family protein